MKTVLVVDDDPVILTTIVKGLSGSGEELELLNAGNGQEAVDILERQPVDLLLTDLYMPVMDGFELLAHMVANFSQVPVIVMSGYDVPEMGDEIARQGALHFVEKPFDLSTLAETVHQTLARTSQGHLTGISLLGFLQLLNFEKKSCCLSVRLDDQSGRLHVAGGELINADCGRLQGESAVFEILSWPDCTIDISVPQHIERMIYRPLHGVILEAARDLDETRAAARRDEPGGDSEAATAPLHVDDELFDEAKKLELQKLLERPQSTAGVIGLALVDVGADEILGSHCYQYWPDFTERAAAAVPVLRRRLEFDDGEQVEEVVTTLEGLVEVWRPLVRRRLAFYLLLNRQQGGLQAARAALEELKGALLELLGTT